MAKADFINEMKALGIYAQEFSSKPNHIEFEYDIPQGIGPNSGKKVVIGAIINDDYPLNPPSAPHFKSQNVPGWVNTLLRLNPSPFGSDWVYWSRNMQLWNSSKRDAKTYMTIVRKILIEM